MIIQLILSLSTKKDIEVLDDFLVDHDLFVTPLTKQLIDERSPSEFRLDSTNLSIDSANEKIDLGGEVVLQAGANPKLSISGSAGNDTIKLEQNAGTALFSFVKANHSDNTSGLHLTAEESGEFKLSHHIDLKSGYYNGKKILDI